MFLSRSISSDVSVAFRNCFALRFATSTAVSTKPRTRKSASSSSSSSSSSSPCSVSVVDSVLNDATAQLPLLETPIPVISKPIATKKPRKTKSDAPIKIPIYKPPYILSLDLGVKKIAYCLFETEPKRIVDWRRVDLEDAGVNTANIEDTVEFFDQFIAEKSRFFEQDCHVLVENQVSSRLRVMQAVAFTVFRQHATTQIINPRRVTGQWATNKKASVEECVRRLRTDTQPDQYEQWSRLLAESSKRDDLADAFLQALYWRHLVWREE